MHACEYVYAWIHVPVREVSNFGFSYILLSYFQVPLPITIEPSLMMIYCTALFS